MTDKLILERIEDLAQNKILMDSQVWGVLTTHLQEELTREICTGSPSIILTKILDICGLDIPTLDELKDYEGKENITPLLMMRGYLGGIIDIHRLFIKEHYGNRGKDFIEKWVIEEGITPRCTVFDLIHAETGELYKEGCEVTWNNVGKCWAITTPEEDRIVPNALPMLLSGSLYVVNKR